MNKSTKGALAASAAAVVLLGGAGSLAFWTATQDVKGGDIASGDLALSAPSCGAGTGWIFDAKEGAASKAFVAGDRLVPGDVLTKICTFNVTAKGEHLRASLKATDASLAPVNALSADLKVDATYTVGTTPIPAEITEANNGDEIKATLVVTFNPASGNGSKNLATTLADITVTATQVHG